MSEESTLLFDPSVKKKKKTQTNTQDASPDGVSEQVADLNVSGEFEFKKKKKKSHKAAHAADDFAKELEKAGVEEAEEGNGGEDDAGGYERLLHRFFDVLRKNNPEMAGDRSGVKYKIPPPVVLRDGSKKTAFSNIKLIADKMHRPEEHVMHYLLTELGTSGSVDGTKRLIIKGRFQQKQIEGVLRRYILEYVTCKTCKSVNTSLTKENRLYFLECNSCGSRRSVQSIKAGYQAVTRGARKKAKAVS